LLASRDNRSSACQKNSNLVVYPRLQRVISSIFAENSRFFRPFVQKLVFDRKYTGISLEKKRLVLDGVSSKVLYGSEFLKSEENLNVQKDLNLKSRTVGTC
jgi:hypothetical protein